MPNIISLYEVVGLVVTVASAGVAYLTSSADTKRQAAAFVSLLGVVLTLIISIRYDLLPRIEDELRIAEMIDKDPQLKGVVVRLSQAEPDGASINPLMDYMIKLRIASVEQNFDRMAQGRFLVEESEMPLFAIQLISSSKKEILATSYVKLTHWWETAWGKQYEEANEEKVKQGVRITRIFIFSSKDEVKGALPLILKELRAGIKVKYVDVENLGAPFTSDMVVIDDSLAGELRLSPDKGMTEAEFYTHPGDVADLKRRLNAVLVQSSDCLLTNGRNSATCE